MIQDPITLYKLIILYMLSRVKMPLTAAQLSEFLLEKNYTTFLTYNNAMDELKKANLITTAKAGNRTLVTVTDEGRETLDFFKDLISDATILEIDSFLKDKEIKIRDDISVIGEYYKNKSSNYEARLTVKGTNENVVEIKLSVPTKELAASICDKWQERHDAVYQKLIEELF